MRKTITELEEQAAALLNDAPVSIQIKPRIPMSGLTNALTGQDMFLDDHEFPAYMELGAQYIEELRPVGVRETQLTQKIIDLNWRLNTISAVENNLFHSSRLASVAPHDPNDDKTVGMTSKAAVWRKDCEGPNAFEKLGRHETRVQRSLFRMTAELERLQAIRLKRGSDTFVLDDCKAWLWYDRMLGLHTELLAARRAALENQTAEAGQSPAPAETTFAAAAAPFFQYAMANGLISPEHQKILDRYNLTR